jgi:transcriptional regulator of acetoin/glycerol metabolism
MHVMTVANSIPGPHGVAGDMSGQGHVAAGDTAALQPIAARSGTAAFQIIVLRSDGGARRATVHALKGPLSVGRAETSDICIEDSGISRVHIQLAPSEAGVELVDLDSRNGTYVDGRRVKRVSQVAGAIVRIGDTFLRVTCYPEDVQMAEPEGPLVGGTALAPVRRLISLVGPTDLPVLVLGETGTGKEVVARLVHEASGRVGPFVAVNCAALPETLVESELFGHVRGAFTGAERTRKGLFAAADQGTLFLDEVGDIPLAAQAKLLRVLEDGLVRPVGAESGFRADVRVLSATNGDLVTAAADGRFRTDLLARLSVVEIRLPPLREHREDLPELASYLMRRSRGHVVPICANALEALLLYEWPQNVRELDNTLRQAMIQTVGGIVLERLPERVQHALHRARHCPASATTAPADLKARLEEALQVHRGNVRRASLALGLARGHVYRLLRRWELDPGAFRRGRHGDC